MLCFNRESLYEDEEFDQRQLAALVVSKVVQLIQKFTCMYVSTICILDI